MRKKLGVCAAIQQRRESLRSVDDQIAYTFNTVRQLGQLSNTYFLLLSDNGFFAGEHRIPTGKHLAYEPSARVPLVIRGPGIQPGAVFDGLAGHQDIAPTILDITDQPLDAAAPALDGMSLLGLLDGSASTDRMMLLERAKVDRYSDERIARTDAQSQLSSVTWPSHGIVTPDRWKYIEHSPTAEVEMYDLTSDPYEETNLAGLPRWATKQAELRDLLIEYQWCSGVACT